MTATPLNYGYAVISYFGKTGNLTATLLFLCVAVKLFYTDKAFLTVWSCFKKVTVNFIWVKELFCRFDLAVLTAPAHI